MAVGTRARLLMMRFGVAGVARGVVVLVVVLALACVLLVARFLVPKGVTLERASEEEQVEEVVQSEEPEEAEVEQVIVHVDGAVAFPGVYELAAGSRANDAVLAAGGPSEGADTSALNLAAPLSDGEKIYVPREGEAADASVPAVAQEGAPVNLNTATAAELDELPGIGESTAAAIIEDREQNGPFATPEDLMRVSGIGEKKYERLEGLVCV